MSVYMHTCTYEYIQGVRDGKNTTADKDSTARAKAICANSSACLGEAPASFLLSRCMQIYRSVFVYKYTYECVCVLVQIFYFRVVSQPLYTHRNMRVFMYVQLWVCVCEYISA